MRAVAFATLLVQLLSSCDTQRPDPLPGIPTEGAVVITYRDSLFAASLAAENRASRSVQLGGGRFSEVGIPADVSHLLGDGRLVVFVRDRQPTSFPSRKFIEVDATNPEQPKVLGDPGDGLYAAVVSESGAPYGLTRRDDEACRGWAVVRMEGTVSRILVCTGEIGEDVRPQRLFVSDDEETVAFSYLRSGRVFGERQDLAVFAGGTSEPRFFYDVTQGVSDMRYSPTTGTLYLVDFTFGTVVGLELEAGGMRTLVPPRTTDPDGANLFLLEDTLITFQRDSATGTTSVLFIDVVLEDRREYTLPFLIFQASENDGYLLFRTFVQTSGRPETFVGLCASSPESFDTFTLDLPAFARETALFSHTLGCE